MTVVAGVWAATALPCLVVGISTVTGNEADQTRQLGVAALATVIPIVLALATFALAG